MLYPNNRSSDYFSIWERLQAHAKISEQEVTIVADNLKRLSYKDLSPEQLEYVMTTIAAQHPEKCLQQLEYKLSRNTSMTSKRVHTMVMQVIDQVLAQQGISHQQLMHLQELNTLELILREAPATIIFYLAEVTRTQEERVRLATMLVKVRPQHLAKHIHLFDIQDPSVRQELAHILLTHDLLMHLNKKKPPSNLEYLPNFHLPYAYRVDLARRVVLHDPLLFLDIVAVFQLTSQDCLELAQLTCPNILISNWNKILRACAFNEQEFVELIKTYAHHHPCEVIDDLSGLTISYQSKLNILKTITALPGSRNTILQVTRALTSNLHKLKILPEDTLTLTPMLVAHQPEGCSAHIALWGLSEQQRLQLALQFIRARHGLTLFCSLNAFELSYAAIKEVAYTAAQESPDALLALFPFSSLLPDDRLQVVIVLAQNVPVALISNFSQVSLENPLHRTQVAYMLLNELHNEIEVFLSHFRGLILTSEKDRFQLAKMIAKSRPDELLPCLPEFDLEESHRMQVLYLAVTYHPQAVIDIEEKYKLEKILGPFTSYQHYLELLQVLAALGINLEDVLEDLQTIDDILEEYADEPALQPLYAIFKPYYEKVPVAIQKQLVFWLSQWVEAYESDLISEQQLTHPTYLHLIAQSLHTRPPLMRPFWNHQILKCMRASQEEELLHELSLPGQQPLFRLYLMLQAQGQCSEIRGLCRELCDKVGKQKDATKMQVILHHLDILFHLLPIPEEAQWRLVESLNHEGAFSTHAKHRQKGCLTKAKAFDRMLSWCHYFRALVELKELDFLCSPALPEGSSSQSLDAMMRHIETLVQKLIPLPPIENFSQKYVDRIVPLRHHELLLTYAAEIMSMQVSDTISQALGMFVFHLLENTYPQQRYLPHTSPHLQQLYEQAPEIYQKWQVSSREPLDSVLFAQEARQDTFNFRNILKQKLFQDHHLSREQVPFLYAYLERPEKASTILRQIEAATHSGFAHSKNHILHMQKQCLELAETPFDPIHYIDSLESILALLPFNLVTFIHDLRGLVASIKERLYKRSYVGWCIECTDNVWDLFIAPTEAGESCQGIGHSSRFHDCLIAFPIDGKNRLIAIKDPEGYIKARAILRLLWDDVHHHPVIYLERHYPSALRPEWETAIIATALKVGKELGVPVIKAGHHPSYKGTAISLGSPAPFEYVDAAEGTMPNGVFACTRNMLLSEDEYYK